MHLSQSPHTYCPLWRLVLSTFCFIFTASTACFLVDSHAGIADNQAELTRLRNEADKAISIGDPQGAALNSGKAALMVAIMAKQEIQLQRKAQFHSLEFLLRTQEHVYRAIALFQQGGEHIPASSGVCGTLSQASSHQENAQILLPNLLSEDPQFQNLPSELQEWKETTEELHADFGCLQDSAY